MYGSKRGPHPLLWIYICIAFVCVSLCAERRPNPRFVVLFAGERNKLKRHLIMKTFYRKRTSVHKTLIHAFVQPHGTQMSYSFPHKKVIIFGKAFVFFRDDPLDK